MIASCGANSGIDTTCVAIVIPARPTPSPKIALSSGRPIASTDPNVISRMTIAAPTPTSSLRPNDGGSPNWPDSSICTPGWSLAATALTASTIVSESRWRPPVDSNCISANAIWEFCGDVVRARTSVMPCTLRRSSNVASMAGFCASIVGAALNTMNAVSPARAGKRLSSRSKAFCESVLGRLKLSPNFVPTDRHRR